MDIGQDKLEEFERLKAMYDGKDIKECFDTMHLKCYSEIADVKVDVEDLKTYAQNIDLAVRDINEKTLEEIRESIQTESEKRLELEYWGRKWRQAAHSSGKFVDRST